MLHKLVNIQVIQYILLISESNLIDFDKFVVIFLDFTFRYINDVIETSVY